MHVNVTAKNADGRISTHRTSQADRGESDFPARAWGAALTILRRELGSSSCTTGPIALLASIPSAGRRGGADRTSSWGGWGPEPWLEAPRAGLVR